ncbi:MAG: hypothetical protein M9959_05790 [Chitinophagaceae bacterium]|nr:hypothetical protein [Chitinophagaceae bacterium]
MSYLNGRSSGTAKGGIKIHTCLDHALMLPDLVNIGEAAVHDKRGHNRKTVFDRELLL